MANQDHRSSLYFEPPTWRAVIAPAAVVLPNLANKSIAQLMEVIVQLQNLVDNGRDLGLFLLHIRVCSLQQKQRVLRILELLQQDGLLHPYPFHLGKQVRIVEFWIGVANLLGQNELIRLLDLPHLRLSIINDFSQLLGKITNVHKLPRTELHFGLELVELIGAGSVRLGSRVQLQEVDQAQNECIEAVQRTGDCGAVGLLFQYIAQNTADHGDQNGGQHKKGQPLLTVRLRFRVQDLLSLDVQSQHITDGGVVVFHGGIGEAEVVLDLSKRVASSRFHRLITGID